MTNPYFFLQITLNATLPTFEDFPFTMYSPTSVCPVTLVPLPVPALYSAKRACCWQSMVVTLLPPADTMLTAAALEKVNPQLAAPKYVPGWTLEGEGQGGAVSDRCSKQSGERIGMHIQNEVAIL